jgi:hypothetical protein
MCCWLASHLICDFLKNIVQAFLHWKHSNKFGKYLVYILN